jgi:hypothetical protein
MLQGQHALLQFDALFRESSMEGRDVCAKRRLRGVWERWRVVLGLEWE